MTHKDTSLFMAWVRGELTFDEYIAAENAADPVTAADARVVAPPRLWWLGVADKMQALRDAQLKQSELRSAA